MNKKSVIAAIRYAYEQGKLDGDFIQDCRSTGEAYDEEAMRQEAIKIGWAEAKRVEKRK